MEQQPPVETRVVLVYMGNFLGRAEGKKKTPPAFQKWCRMDGAADTYREQIEKIDPDKVMSYDGKGMPFCRPGAIYSFKVGENQTSIYPSSAAYVGRIDILFEDLKDMVVKWQIEYDAFRAAENAKRNEKSEALAELPWEVLEPFRRTYHRLHGPQQAALIIQVLDAIRKY